MKQVIKNLKEAADRIKKAAREKENVIIYGDADLDGVAAAIIMEETARNLGGNVVARYFPDREFEGYGITKTALSRLKIYSPALLVSVDLGIGNFEEVKEARQLGFSTVIIDHHEIIDGLPEADIIVDPKQPQDDYPFKFFSAAGLALRVSQQALGGEMGPMLKKSFLELAALATIADMMPRESENIEIIDEGLEAIDKTFRPGLQAFFESDVAFESGETLNKKLNRIVSVLNVRDMKNGVPAAYKLLTAKTTVEAREMIARFLEINQLRRERIKEVSAEIENRIARGFGEPIIFEGSADWEINLIGTIASIINSKYAKPVFIYKTLDGVTQGTVRSTEQVDSVALMKKCKDLLISFGGHPKASGFRLKTENLEKFKTCLIGNMVQ